MKTESRKPKAETKPNPESRSGMAGVLVMFILCALCGSAGHAADTPVPSVPAAVPANIMDTILGVTGGTTVRLFTISNATRQAMMDLTNHVTLSTNAYKVRGIIAGSGMTGTTNTATGVVTLTSTGGGGSLVDATNHVTLATNDLNTALVTKITNHVALGTNDLNTALVAKITNHVALATNDLNTALVAKITNHVALATNDLNTALVTKLTDATNDLNTALVAKVTASTNAYKVREVAATGNPGFASTNTSTGLVTINPWAQTNVASVNATNASQLQSTLTVGSAAGATGTTLTLTNRAQASTRESLITARVSDAPNCGFFVYNGTSADANFMPSFGGLNTNTSGASLNFNAFLTTDRDISGAFPAVVFTALVSTSEADPANGTLSAIANRNLFGFRNNGVMAGVVNATGVLAWNTNANFGAEVAITNGTTGSALLVNTNATGPGNTTTIRSWVKIRDANGKTLYLPAYE